MSPVDRMTTQTPEEREAAVEAASAAVRREELVVIPTDTVYGVAGDAFSHAAVTALLEAKGRGRAMPPPVLISAVTTLDALADAVPQWARALVEAHWPGPLTLVLRQQSSLMWDLGDAQGTVAVRMPDDEVALAVLERTGPLAVSSANITGEPAAQDADAAERMLGEKVSVIVDGGPSRGGEASTIVDATGEEPRILRQGALSREDLAATLEPLGVTLTDTLPGEG